MIGRYLDDGGSEKKGQSERRTESRLLNTNLRANGAYIAPCAGLEGDVVSINSQPKM
jgi:hypothetical protein